MNNIPMFTTENGIASLTLREVQERGKAYIQFRDGNEALLKDCVDFCKACGAERIYAAGFPQLENYFPLTTHVYRMSCPKESLTGQQLPLWPLLPENAEKWRQLYNEAMEAVDHAAYLSRMDMKEHLRAGDCYFIHRGEEIVGIGKANGEVIVTLASFVPGHGALVLRSLASLLTGERVVLEVASTNTKAIHLYEKMGFLITGMLESWYQVL